MNWTQVDEEDILTTARETHGLERLEQIKYAVLEIDWGISIIPKPDAKKQAVVHQTACLTVEGSSQICQNSMRSCPDHGPASVSFGLSFHKHHVRCRFLPVVDVQFFDNAMNVIFYSPDFHYELGGDFLVGKSLADKAQYFKFPLR